MSHRLDAASAAFLQQARQRYVDANRGTLEWMLDRPRLHGALLNTRMHSIELRDYTEADGWRAPSVVCGWIQGRGLEALLIHADYFAASDPAFAERLVAAARDLYAAVKALYLRHDGFFFLYDGQLNPAIRDADDNLLPQRTGTGFFTYSDVFALKGLIAASTRFEPESRAAWLDKLAQLVAAIEADRFFLNERVLVEAESLSPPGADFGPRMIVLGAAGMLKRLGLDAHAGFGDRFIDHILEHHWDRDGSGLLSNQAGGTRGDIGHAIEFVGFALDYLRDRPDDPRIGSLQKLLTASFAAGYVGPGITLQVELKTGERIGHFPWWSLPETVRSAALCFEATGQGLDIWTAADRAFFSGYWRGTPSIAYQTFGFDGPIDFIPGTPDLDPGYHTGLSLLAAIEVAERMRG